MQSHERVIHLGSGTGAKPIPCLTADSLPAGILYTYYTDESEAERGRERGERLRKRREKVGPRGEQTGEGQGGARSMRG